MQSFPYRRLHLPAICVAVCLLLADKGAAQTQTPAPRSTIGDSISTNLSKIGDAVTPKPVVKPPDDAVSLQSKGKPGIDLYVALGRFYEEAGNFTEAEKQYKRAAQEAPNDLRVLLGYARLKDRMSEPDEALRLYQRAARAYPQEPSVFNNLAVHYARQGMLREAVGQVEQSIRLRPKEVKYRNNMATLLVELGRPQEAYAQLRAVHNEAEAHYNLAFLLNRKGHTQLAVQELHTALKLNPSMAQARQLLERVTGTASQNPRGPAQEPRPAVQEPRTAMQSPRPTASEPKPGLQEVRIAAPGPSPGARTPMTVESRSPRWGAADRDNSAAGAMRAVDNRPGLQGPPIVEYPQLPPNRTGPIVPPTPEGQLPRLAANPAWRPSPSPPAWQDNVNARPENRWTPTQAGAGFQNTGQLPVQRGITVVPNPQWPPQNVPRPGNGDQDPNANLPRPADVRSLPPPPQRIQPWQPTGPQPEVPQAPERLPPTGRGAASGPELVAPMPPGN